MLFISDEDPYPVLTRRAALMPKSKTSALKLEQVAVMPRSTPNVPLSERLDHINRTHSEFRLPIPPATNRKAKRAPYIRSTAPSGRMMPRLLCTPKELLVTIDIAHWLLKNSRPKANCDAADYALRLKRFMSRTTAPELTAPPIKDALSRRFLASVPMLK